MVHFLRRLGPSYQKIDSRIRPGANLIDRRQTPTTIALTSVAVHWHFPDQIFRNRSGGNQENAPHGIGRNHDEKVVVIDFIAIILSSKSPMS
ncbi:MAG: hypothetical protein VKL42_17975, partial [Snowella sp.]|nr:hypothetical protein [Snowella sp.]